MELQTCRELNTIPIPRSLFLRTSCHSPCLEARDCSLFVLYSRTLWYKFPLFHIQEKGERPYAPRLSTLSNILFLCSCSLKKRKISSTFSLSNWLTYQREVEKTSFLFFQKKKGSMKHIFLFCLETSHTTLICLGLIVVTIGGGPLWAETLFLGSSQMCFAGNETGILSLSWMCVTTCMYYAT